MPRAWSFIATSSTRDEDRVVQYISTFLKRSDPYLLHTYVPEIGQGEKEEKRVEQGRLENKIILLLRPHLHRIQCLSVTSRQLATLSQERMPNLRRVTLADAAPGLEPFFINNALFPRIQYLDLRWCDWVRCPSPDLFPCLQHLSLPFGRGYTWLEIIRSCSSTLKSLKISGYFPGYWPPIGPISFPRLQNLSISDWRAKGSRVESPSPFVTPALISYEEYTGDRLLPRVLHKDVQSVIHLRSSSIIKLSSYLNLRTLHWSMPDQFPVIISFARQLTAQLRDRNTCPALRVVALHAFPSETNQPDYESAKHKVPGMIKKARSNVEVLFTTKVKHLPGSMREIEVSIILCPVIG